MSLRDLPPFTTLVVDPIMMIMAGIQPPAEDADEAAWEEALAAFPVPEPIDLFPGLYLTKTYNFNHLLPEGLLKDEYPFDPMGLDIGTWNEWHEQQTKAEQPTCAYGVCDTPEQLVEKYPGLVRAPGHHIVAFTHVAKNPDNANLGGGWRWHKWGPYIGEGEPTMEYLDDEPGFDDGVFVYHIYELNEDLS